MPELIRLTLTDGRRIYVNPHHIQCINPPLPGGTAAASTRKVGSYISFSETDYAAVQETPEEIADNFAIYEVSNEL